MCVYSSLHMNAHVWASPFEMMQMSLALPDSHLAVRPNLQGICAANYFSLQLWVFWMRSNIQFRQTGAQQGLKCKVRLWSVDFSQFHMWPVVWKSIGNTYKLSWNGSFYYFFFCMTIFYATTIFREYTAAEGWNQSVVPQTWLHDWLTEWEFVLICLIFASFSHLGFFFSFSNLNYSKGKAY